MVITALALHTITSLQPFYGVAAVQRPTLHPTCNVLTTLCRARAFDTEEALRPTDTRPGRPGYRVVSPLSYLRPVDSASISIYTEDAM